MKSTEQPLKALGIDPALVRTLSLDDAHGTVIAIGSTLQKRWHPDRSTGDEARFRVVTAALEQIKSVEAFQPLLEDFLKPRKTQVAELEAKVRKLQQQSRFHEDRAQAYMLLPLSDSPTVFDAVARTISVTDIIRSEMSFKIRDSSMFVTLEIDERGAVKLSRNGKTKTISRRLIGTLPADVDIRKYMLLSQPDRAELAGRLTTGVQFLGSTVQVKKQIKIGKNRLPVQGASPIVRRLRPEILPQRYLFSAQEIEGEQYVYLEGRITSIGFATGAESI